MSFCISHDKSVRLLDFLGASQADPLLKADKGLPLGRIKDEGDCFCASHHLRVNRKVSRLAAYVPNTHIGPHTVLLVYELVKISADHHAGILDLDEGPVDVPEELSLAGGVAAEEHDFEHIRKGKKIYQWLKLSSILGTLSFFLASV